MRQSRIFIYLAVVFSVFAWYESASAQDKSVTGSTRGKTEPSINYLWTAGAWSECQAPAFWDAKEWGACNAPDCGSGQQTRQVACSKRPGSRTREISCKSSEGKMVAESFCKDAKPEQMMSCQNECDNAMRPEDVKACESTVKVCEKEKIKEEKGQGIWSLETQRTVEGCMSTTAAGAVEVPHGKPCDVEGAVKYVRWGGSNAAIHLTTGFPNVCPQGDGPTIQNTYRCVFCANQSFREEPFVINEPNDPNMHKAWQDVRRFKCDGAPRAPAGDELPVLKKGVR